MVMLLVLLTMRIFGMADCQVSWPTNPPDTSSVLDECTASNGEKGICHEFRSTEFEECPFFPGTDTSNTNDAKHLTANICRNTGRQIYFCCPFNSSPSNPAQSPEDNDSQTTLFPDDECGVSFSNNIVGGEIVSEHAWPWLAAIGNKTSLGFAPFCGGTLITKQHVLTAAHCFKTEYSYPDTIVRLGEHNWQVNEGREIDFKIIDERKGNHNSKTKENDIMVIKLDRPLDSFTDSVAPACLPFNMPNDDFAGHTLTVVGWGRFTNTGKLDQQISPAPQQANVPVVPVVDCRNNWKKLSQHSPTVIDDRQLCAGTNRIDSCNGDSGGPLNYLDSKSSRFFVVGIVSFGHKICGFENAPGVYTRIGHYLEWIKKSVGQMQS